MKRERKMVTSELSPKEAKMQNILALNPEGLSMNAS